MEEIRSHFTALCQATRMAIDPSSRYSLQAVLTRKEGTTSREEYKYERCSHLASHYNRAQNPKMNRQPDTSSISLTTLTPSEFVEGISQLLYRFVPSLTRRGGLMLLDFLYISSTVESRSMEAGSTRIRLEVWKGPAKMYIVPP
jgi:hypothetical protein